MMRSRRLFLLGFSLAALLTHAARGQEPNAYGTSAATLVQIPATACTPLAGTTSVVSADGYVYPNASPGEYDCPLDLPAGAKVVKIGILAHDESDDGQAQTVLAICDVTAAPGTSCTGAGFAASIGTSSAPQTGRFLSPDMSASNIVVDKTNHVYSARAEVFNTVAGDVRFRGLEVYYRLQVSTPAPGTQTFGDVPPSFLYYKGIEALAASGITGGCGNGNFCPGAYVTRGEIAAFFARALGLHFPN